MAKCEHGHWEAPDWRFKLFEYALRVILPGHKVQVFTPCALFSAERALDQLQAQAEATKYLAQGGQYL